MLSRDGWVKRVREVKDPTATRLREGDALVAVAAGHDARSPRALLEHGHASTCCASPTCPATTGYGEPVQSLLKFGDGERVVAARLSASRRRRGRERAPAGAARPRLAEEVAAPVSRRDRQGLRLPRHARSHRDHARRPAPGARRRRRRGRLGRVDRPGRWSSSRRRAARCCASRSTRSPSSSGPGRGVILMRPGSDDRDRRCAGARREGGVRGRQPGGRRAQARRWPTCPSAGAAARGSGS